MLYQPAGYLGNYRRDKTIYFKWSSVDADGASITLGGTAVVTVYKNNNTDGTIIGVSHTINTPVTGIHHCSIDLTSSCWYENYTDYSVIVDGITIDGENVNPEIASFSINNRAT